RGGWRADAGAEGVLGGAAMGERRSGNRAQRIGGTLETASRQYQPAILRKSQGQQVAQQQHGQGGQQGIESSAALQGVAERDREQQAHQRVDGHHAAGQRPVPAKLSQQDRQYGRQLELLEGNETGEAQTEGNGLPIGTLALQYLAAPIQRRFGIRAGAGRLEGLVHGAEVDGSATTAQPFPVSFRFINPRRIKGF